MPHATALVTYIASSWKLMIVQKMLYDESILNARHLSVSEMPAYDNKRHNMFVDLSFTTQNYDTLLNGRFHHSKRRAN